ncbi:hypothetical protein As57867_015828, partial [Aphanomyces stellatus]
VHNEKILRKELFQWDLALSAEQALQRISKLAKSAAINGVVPSYNLMLLCDDMGETDARTMDRYLRTLDGKKASNPTQQCVVGMILTNSTLDLPYATTLCQPCRVAQGRRVSAAAVDSSADGTCPHCGIIPKALVERAAIAPSFVQVAHVFIFRHIRPPTLHRLAERWWDQVVAKKSEQMNRGAEVEVHKGLTKEALLREMDYYLQMGRRGNFAPKDYIPEMALSAVETAVINTNLTSKPPHSA